jgi:hypothetical protein
VEQAGRIGIVLARMNLEGAECPKMRQFSPRS